MSFYFFEPCPILHIIFRVEVFEMLKEVRGAAKGGLAGSITTQETMKPLFFKRPVNPIQNNILLDESELETPEPIGENSSMINYYFNVFVRVIVVTFELVIDIFVDFYLLWEFDWLGFFWWKRFFYHLNELRVMLWLSVSCFYHIFTIYK